MWLLCTDITMLKPCINEQYHDIYNQNIVLRLMHLLKSYFATMREYPLLFYWILGWKSVTGIIYVFCYVL